jgi:hypothetical protein
LSVLPTVSMTVMPRYRRAIAAVSSVQLSAITTIRSACRVWVSSACSVCPIVSASLWAGTRTSSLRVVRRRGWR